MCCIILYNHCKPCTSSKKDIVSTNIFRGILKNCFIIQFRNTLTKYVINKTKIVFLFVVNWLVDNFFNSKYRLRRWVWVCRIPLNKFKVISIHTLFHFNLFSIISCAFYNYFPTFCDPFDEKWTHEWRQFKKLQLQYVLLKARRRVRCVITPYTSLQLKSIFIFTW